MTIKSLKKTNLKLRFLHGNNDFLNIKPRTLLYNSLIQPLFDYACIACLVRKKIRKKMQNIQNKCIRFCLNSNSSHHLGTKEFKEINWLKRKEEQKNVLSQTFLRYM